MFTHKTKRPSAARVIIYTPEPGHGLAVYVSQLVVALANRDIPVVLLCPANFEHGVEVRKAGAEVVHAGEREVCIAGFGRRVVRNLKFVAKAAVVEFRLVRPGDIVHFQSMFHLPIGLVFLFVAKVSGGSIVLTAHDPLPHRWRLPRVFRRLDRKMLQLSYRWCDRIIVHNRQGKELLVREFQLEERRIVVVPHGPYPVEASPEFPAFDSLRVLAFGAIRENKGLHLAIEAVQQAATSSRIPIRLTIAGCPQNAAEQHYWEECKELIRRRPDHIEVIEGLIPEKDIPGLMARHHAVLLPYTEFHSESGVAALALSHQRALLATAAGGMTALIEQASCVIAIGAASASSVAQAMLNAIDLGPDRLQEMGVNGRRFILRERSWDSVARQSADVYSSLSRLKSRSKPAGAGSARDEVSVPPISCP